jgi:hypothetical protein
MTRNGLTRLIMIGSGVSDYVEIEPSKSTHLVADNNIGKTSILSTLQFLLIDDWKHMDFPKSRLETEEFYFKSRKSLIIFEIKDAEGTEHLVIFRGNGLASNKRYTRWIMGGHFDKSIFISENEDGELVPNEWEIIVANAANQRRPIDEFRTANELRKRLRSNPRWLPTIEGTAHNNFITVLKTLNTLGEVKEKKLKQVLLDINESLELSMDFSKEFGVQWYDYQERKLSHIEISKKSESILKAKQYVEQKGETQTQIIEMLNEIGPSIESLSNKMESLKEHHQKNIVDVQNELVELDLEKGKLQNSVSKLNRDEGSLGTEIRRHEDMEKWASDKTIVSLEKLSKDAEKEYFSLKNRVMKAELQEYESSERIQVQIQKYQTDVSNLKTALENKQHTLIDSLQKHNLEFSPDPWKVLNPQLLIQTGAISNPYETKLLLETISSSITNLSLDYHGINVESLEGVQGSGQFDNPEEIRNEYNDKIRILEAMRVRLKDIENYEKLQSEMEICEKEFNMKRKDVDSMKEWEENGKTLLAEKREEMIKLLEDKKESETAVISVEENHSKVKAKLSRMESELGRLESRNGNVLQDWMSLQQKFIPNLAFNAEGKLELEEIETEIFKLRQIERKYDKADKKVTEYQLELYSLSAHVMNPSSEDFFPMIFERLQNLELEKENLGKEWINIATNMGSKANNLKQSLNKLRQEVHEINKLFRGTNVSNLDEFSVEFIEHSNDVSLIKNISNLTAFSAWTKDEDEVAAINSLGDAMTSRSSINIADLFHLRYNVKNKGSEKQMTIDNLDDSGSTGTVTIIKAVLLMILLKKTLKYKQRSRVPLPIYLDEVGILGPRNYNQIIEVSNSLGFQIFTASPKSVETADVVYPLIGGRSKDRLFVTPEFSRPKPTTLGEEEE